MTALPSSVGARSALVAKGDHVVRKLSVLFALMVLLVLPGTATAKTTVTATFQGQQIAVSDIGKLHCHDRAYPIVKCFATDAEVEADLGIPAQSVQSLAKVQMAPQYLYPYVVVYDGTNYTGPSYWAFNALPDLRTVGWNDRIASAQGINGYYVQFWADLNYTRGPWQDGPDEDISTFAMWNDQWTSMRPCFTSGTPRCYGM